MMSMPRSKDPLTDYRRKRDFRRTAEPAGDAQERGPDGDLVFVIQKHAASHLHFDLRLELDGVMKSWAVPKGPSLDPSVKRLAMQVEDHPMEYNSFEGTIPKGEYGGGTVMLWDHGTYSPDEPRRGEGALAAARRGLRAGKLSFSLSGKRLRGSFALVRTDQGAKPKWLFFKHRDEHAASDRDITADVITSVASGRTMDEIAAGHSRVWRSNRRGRSGGEQRARTAAAASSPDGMIAPMLPEPAEQLPAAGRWTYEPWHGGSRLLAYVTPEAARLIDAAGSDVTRSHGQLAVELASLAVRAGRPFVLDGELFSGTDETDTFIASDLLMVGEEVTVGRTWEERRAALDTLLRRRRLQRIARQETSDDGDGMLRRARRRKLPGILARRLDAPYLPGARSDAFLRIPLV
jgi:bifunctional non-homologous end joining protein LigD